VNEVKRVLNKSRSGMVTAEFNYSHTEHNALDAQRRNAQIARGLHIVAIASACEMHFVATRFFVGIVGELRAEHRPGWDVEVSAHYWWVRA
jgi:hypothetical protein